MQLNVYIPRDKEHLLAALTEESQRTGRSKNELVLEAIEQHVSPPGTLDYRIYPLGAGSFDRGDLYEDSIA